MNTSDIDENLLIYFNRVNNVVLGSKIFLDNSKGVRRYLKVNVPSHLWLKCQKIVLSGELNLKKTPKVFADYTLIQRVLKGYRRFFSLISSTSNI